MGDEPQKKQRRGGTGIAMGIALGAALGVVFGNIPIGVALGLAIGVAIDSVWNRQQEEDDQSEDE